MRKSWISWVMMTVMFIFRTPFSWVEFCFLPEVGYPCFVVLGCFSWWDVTDGGYEYVYDKDVFLPDHKYQCEVYVKTDDGYEFLMNTKTDPPTVPSVIVNGNPGDYTTLYGSGLNFEQEVKYVFNCSEQTLSKVGVIELSQPIAGGTPDYVATTLAPHLYEVTKITWYDALGEELPANTTFIAGMVYRVDVQIETNIVVDNNKDYRVAYFDCSTGKTSLNGVELEMINSKDANKEDLEEYFNHAYCTGANKPINLCYTFKPAPRPTIGDVNFDNEVNLKDVVRLKKLLVGNPDNDSNADVNFDGIVNALDIAFLIKLLLQ